jgi:hypothetical protein
LRLGADARGQGRRQEASAAKGAMWQATRDGNSVFFSPNQQPDFEDLKDAIEEMMAKQAAGGGDHSAADELEKLAGLLEKGLITRAEFNRKKRELLG